MVSYMGLMKIGKQYEREAMFRYLSVLDATYLDVVLENLKKEAEKPPAK